MDKVVFEVGDYRVIDARDWKFRFCVEGLTGVVMMSLSKKDAIALAKGLADLEH